jgi:hypothetical protein
MHHSSRSQNIKGVLKPTQQKYDSARVVRHIRFDAPTDQTLYHALEILSGTDRVSIGLVVRRAINHYAESLLRSPEAYREAERAAVRKGARVARQSSAA